MTCGVCVSLCSSYVSSICTLIVLSLEAIIGIAAGGAGAILLVCLVILLLVCVYMCARKGRTGGVFHLHIVLLFVCVYKCARTGGV